MLKKEKKRQEKEVLKKKQVIKMLKPSIQNTIELVYDFKKIK